MNKIQFIYGACIAAILNLILLLTGLGEEIILKGLIIAQCILFIFISVIKIMIGNSCKDNSNVNWKSIASFIIGALIITIITISLACLAII